MKTLRISFLLLLFCPVLLLFCPVLLLGQTADFTLSSTTVCIGEAVTITDNSGSVTSWSWDFGVDASVSTATTGGTHSISWSSPGVKRISLIVEGNLLNIVKKDVTVKPNIETPTAITVFSLGGDPTCQLTNGTTTTTYATTATNSTGYIWSVDNASAGTIDASGVMTWANNFAGSVNIQVRAVGCNGPSVQVVRPVVITPTVGTPTAIAVLAGSNPSCQLLNGTTTTAYTTTATNSTGFNWSLSDGSAGVIGATTGVMTWANDFAGSVDVQVTASGCNGSSTQVSKSITITPTVGTPTVITVSGSEPTCQLVNGTTTTSYSTTATNSTGFNWSIDNASAGSINATTGVMTWADGFAGSVHIKVTANGCNGPSAEESRLVIILPTVGIPTAITVFSLGGDPTCQLTNGTTTTTYATTATNSTGYIWSVDNASAGSIDASGVMTWANNFVGSVNIQVRAVGCNGPSVQVVRPVVITPTVGTPTAIAVLAGSNPSCQLLNGTTTTAYTTTATNSTGFNWSLSDGSAGVIGATTGVMTWANDFAGSVDVQVTASGCNGSSTQVSKSITITPTVGTPTAITVSGSEPTCQLVNGTTTTSYSTTATNSTGFNWSIDNASAGSINATTGVMTWADGFAGSVHIKVTANGCNGPSAEESRLVIILPTVGIPTAITVFSLGGDPTCQLTNGTTTTTYATTATNSTGYIWSVDNASAGSIDASGVMTWANNFAGSVNIQVRAVGCNGPSVQVVRPVVITPTVGTPTAIAVLAGSNPSCQLLNGTTTTAYTTTATNSTGFNWSLSDGSAGVIGATTGVMTWANDFAGSVDVQVTASGCNGSSTQVSKSITITPTVGTPTAITVSGSEPTCQLVNGTTTTSYSTTATNSTGFNWSIDNASAGSINATTGVMTWADGFAGSVHIKVTANGCNGPSAEESRLVIILPTVGIPTAITVFSLGGDPTCQLTNGTTTTTYATTATNSTGYIWSVDNASAGSIDASGVMTWANNFAGSVNIQVRAVGCNGPSVQVVRPVVITPTVGTPTAIAVLAGSNPSCQLLNGTTTTAYTTTATNSTGFNWSLSDGSAGVIGATTGVMTWANDFAGSVDVQVTASGCNGSSTQVSKSITITPTVGTPTVITVSGSEPTCQLVNGTTTTSYSTTATNSTGFNWSIDNASAGSINATTGVMTWADGFAGSVHIKVTANGCNGPSAEESRLVIILPTVGIPTAITVFSLGGDPTCQLTNGTTTTTYATTATNSTGYIWSVDNASAGSIDASGVMTWANNFAGSVNIQVRAVGCNGPSVQVTRFITINPKPLAPTVINDSICDSGVVKLWANTLSGTLHWYDVPSAGTSLGTGNIFTTPLITSTTLYYVDVTQNGCVSPRSTVKGIVNYKFHPGLFGLLPSYNVTDNAGYTLTGSPSNGVFSGKGVIGNTFYPFVAGLNSSGFDIKYTYTTNKGCVDSVKQTVTVISSTAGFPDLNNVYCMNSPASTILFTTTETVDAGSVVCSSYFQDNSGNIIDNGNDGLGNPLHGVKDIGNGSIILTPSQMRAGRHYLLASYKISGVPFTTSAQFFTVDTIPTVDIDNLASAYCDYSTNTTVRLRALKTGTNGSHIWTDFNNSTTNSNRDYFDLDLTSVAPSVNPYSISYQFETANNCLSNIATKTFLMHDLPTVSIAPDTVFNAAGSAFNLKGNYVDEGVFSGSGVNELVANSKYQFLPSAVGGQSNVLITYKYTDPTTLCVNSTSTNFSIYQATDTIRGDIRVFCHLENPVTFSISNKHGVTGSFRLARKPTAMVDGANNSAIFNPSVFKEGVDTIIYSYNYKNAAFQVRKLVSVDSVSSAVNFTVPASKFDYCNYDNAVQLTATNLYPDPTKGFGTWIYPAGLLTTANNIATLDPSQATAETNPVSYYYTSAGGCVSRTASHDFTIYTRPSISFTNLKGNYNVAVDTFILRGYPSSGGVGVFSGNGLSVDGVLRPGNVGVRASSPVSYQFTETRSNCSSTANATINIIQSAATITTSKNVYCYTDAPDIITGVATNGQPIPVDGFSGPGVTYFGNSQATFDPKLAGTGNKTITYTYLGNDGYTEFSVSKTVLVDEIAIARISGLKDEYCTSADRQLINGFISNNNGTANFEGPETGFHNQGLNAFFNTDTIGMIESPVRIRLTYTSPQGCITRDSAFITIHKTPELAFGIVNACFDKNTSAKPVLFPNQSVYNSSDNITWTWDYGDNSGKITSFQGSHSYSAGGPMLITLAAQTDKGCVSIATSKTVNIDTRPSAKFIWSDECFVANNPIQFTNKTSNIQSANITYDWYFKNSNGQTDTVKGLEHSSKLYSSPGDYGISLVAVTQEGCRDTSSVVFHLRPTYRLADKEYRENFESAHNYWIDTTTVSSPNRWVWGIPTDQSACKFSASGSNVVYTQVDTRTQKDQLALVGPCFDFTGTQRPVISFQSWKAFELNRDGAVLQYLKGNATDWVTIGVKDDGINWYNSNSIIGNPLNISQGWTCASDNAFDSVWYDSRHSLDDLKGQSKVRFRFVFVSNGTGQVNKGFALDSIWIGERKRNVVVEHFGDNSDAAKNAEKLLDNAVSQYPNDILNIRYHTGSDPFGLLYPAGPRIRSMLYKITKVPFSIVDGLNTSKYVDYSSVLWNDNSYRNLMLESLYDPKFDLAVTSEGSNTAKVQVKIGNRVALPAAKRILYVVAIESDVVVDGVTYKNVLRGMLPDASGTSFESAWLPATTEDVSLTWEVTNVTDASKLRFVAFMQDDVTKEVYQAAIDSPGSISTGETLLHASVSDKIVVYPNPASGFCNIALTGTEQYPVKADILNQYGAILASQVFGKGETLSTMKIEGIPNGVYILRLMGAKGGVIHSQKLVILHR